MHMHGHEVPSARRAGSRAMHVRDTHRLTGRSITRSVVALGPDGARKDADVAAKQRQAASASREHPPSGVAFSAASDAAVRSLHRGRTDQTPETVRGVAGRALLLQVLGTRDTAARAAAA
jgi:hypothetical protein